jgi:hypothetical protein
LQQMARVREDATKLLRGMVPWFYDSYMDTEPVGHLIGKDVWPLECSFPCQTVLLKGSVSFKESEDAKAIPDGSNQPKGKNQRQKRRLSVILLIAQKCVTRNLWASHVWQHLYTLHISIGLQSLHQYLQERQWLFWKLYR